MRKVINFVVVAVLAGEALIVGQGSDVAKLLTTVREALGGEEKIAAVKSLSAVGNFQKVGGMAGDYELAIELPDKFVQKQPAISMPMMTLGQARGFNGNDLISQMDAPPQQDGMTMNIVTRSSQGTPEQQQAARKTDVMDAKQRFAQITLGMFAASFSAYPLHFAAATSDAAVENGDVVSVKADGDFDARLVIDKTSHLPMMLIWQAKEPVKPITITRGGGPDSGTSFSSGGSPQDMEKMQQDMAARQKDAANRPLVEHRLSYSDFRMVDGLKMPFHFSRSIAGKPAEEITLSSIRINAKIDPKKFDIAK
jgi:hypothetical protein